MRPFCKHGERVRSLEANNRRFIASPSHDKTIRIWVANQLILKRRVRRVGGLTLKENEISERVIGCGIEVHRQLGPGLLESVYEEALCYELSKAHLNFERQQAVPIKYKQVLLATPLRLDLIVERKVIVDNKAKAQITPIDKQQVLTYLRLRDVRLGLLINFNVAKLVDGVVRVVNGLDE